MYSVNIHSQSVTSMMILTLLPTYWSSLVQSLELHPSTCFQATWRATTPSWTRYPVHRSPSVQCQDLQESPGDPDLQGLRENRDLQGDPAHMDNQDRADNLEKEVRRDTLNHNQASYSSDVSEPVLFVSRSTRREGWERISRCRSPRPQRTSRTPR